MPREIPIKTRWEIVFCREHLKLTQQEIAHQTGCSQSNVHSILAKYQRTGDVVDLPRSGRKRLLDIPSYNTHNNPIILATRAGNHTWIAVE